MEKLGAIRAYLQDLEQTGQNLLVEYDRTSKIITVRLTSEDGSVGIEVNVLDHLGDFNFAILSALEHFLDN